MRPGESLQSFDVYRSDPEIDGHIVYCKVSTSSGKATKAEIFTRRINSNVPENIVPANEGAFYLDPTVAEGHAYYVSTAYGGQSLMRVKLNQTSPTQLTSSSSKARAPRALANQVAYVADASAYGKGDVSVINASGGPRRVFGSGCQPTWTSDGKNILFVDEDKICKVAADGTGNRTELFNGGGKLLIKDPALSPDNRMIAYAALTSGEKPNYDIYVLEVESDQPRHLTSLDSTDDMPRWLDDHTILFRSSRGAKWGIWQIDLEFDDPTPQPVETPTGM